jgi:sugar phosphate permease
MKVIEAEKMISLNNSSNDSKTSLIDSSRAWIIISCAWAFYLYEYILRVSPSVMTNDLMLDFGVTTTALGVLVSFYYLSYVTLQIPCGVIVDRFGARKVITLSAALCVLGCVLFANSHSLFAAQMGRFLMGAGSACAYLSCAKIGAEWFSASKFAMITGATMFMGTFGGIFGASPFAYLVNGMGWRNSTLVAALVGVVVVIASWFIIRDHPEDRKDENKPVEGQNLLDGLKIISRNPQNWIIGLYGCMMYLPLSAFAELWGVPFLMQKYGINNEVASTASIMVFMGMGIGSIASAYVSDYIQSRVKVMGYSALVTLISFLVVFYLPNIPFKVMLVILFVGGFASGGQILYFAAAKENNPHHISGTVVGFTNFFVMVSGLVFQPLLGFLLDFMWDGQLNLDGSPLYTTSTYEKTFAAVCFALLVSWICSNFIRETYPQDPEKKA